MDTLYTQRATEKYNLRLPKRVKERLESRAKEEGLSLNSAIIQRLVWSLNNDKSMQHQ
ncbi:Arc family DNA-binding protein [Morganella morganii]|uniref:Arc family DNA-binding protein n=1 Tax=Morganella morganii TaxID=582 RepID=UPI001BD9E501|nr:Arc family DNA-binding protein [Morganella morganii]EJD6109722.1 Arc family DNA-binding protein [Morganella morganii]EKU4014337.1 Arc family DNA-binding protein [Morganella morganii]ELA7703349.1 Arc family DNA-binding protein [Morganella morganii]MBT0504652.1 Arc family DNA-binding protein [Morganella morganii subsp. morganii]MDW7787210.1 Arc family DNA-binding protein [Morganella morganii]